MARGKAGKTNQDQIVGRLLCQAKEQSSDPLVSEKPLEVFKKCDDSTVLKDDSTVFYTLKSVKT